MGAQAEVRKGNLPYVKRHVLASGIWRLYCPVRVKNLWVRAISFGLLFMAISAVPVIIVTGVLLHGNEHHIRGHIYPFFKGAFGVFVILQVFPGMFVSAIVEDNFEPGELKTLLLDEPDDGSGQMVDVAGLEEGLIAGAAPDSAISSPTRSVASSRKQLQ